MSLKNLILFSVSNHWCYDVHVCFVVVSICHCFWLSVARNSDWTPWLHILFRWIVLRGSSVRFVLYARNEGEKFQRNSSGAGKVDTCGCIYFYVK